MNSLLSSLTATHSDHRTASAVSVAECADSWDGCRLTFVALWQSFERRAERAGGMKRWPIITASMAGALIGFLSTIYVGMAVALHTSLTTTANVVLVTVCPVIYVMWWRWWLVPILNAILYGGLAFGIAKWRLGHKQSHQISK